MAGSEGRRVVGEVGDGWWSISEDWWSISDCWRIQGPSVMAGGYGGQLGDDWWSISDDRGRFVMIGGDC